MMNENELNKVFSEKEETINNVTQNKVESLQDHMWNKLDSEINKLNDDESVCNKNIVDEPNIDDISKIKNNDEDDEFDVEINKLLESDNASEIAPETLYEVENALNMPHKDISEYSVYELNNMKNKVFKLYAKLTDFDGEVKGLPKYKKIPNKKFKKKNKMRKLSKKKNRGRR